MKSMKKIFRPRNQRSHSVQRSAGVHAGTPRGVVAFAADPTQANACTLNFVGDRDAQENAIRNYST